MVVKISCVPLQKGGARSQQPRLKLGRCVCASSAALQRMQTAPEAAQQPRQHTACSARGRSGASGAHAATERANPTRGQPAFWAHLTSAGTRMCEMAILLTMSMVLEHRL